MQQEQQQYDVFGWLAMAAAVTVAAYGEWSLGQAAGFGEWVAAALPVAIDSYAIRAMQRGREVAPAVALMIATNAAAHLHASGQLPMNAWVVVAVSAIAPVVFWRVHALRRTNAPRTPQPPRVEPERNTSEAEVNTPRPEPVPAPVHPAPAEALPAPTNTLVICGEHLPIPDVPPRPRITDPAEARRVIEQAWADGLSVRLAARRATRSPARVQAVYTELDAKRPMDGQTAIDIEGVAA